MDLPHSPKQEWQEINSASPEIWAVKPGSFKRSLQRPSRRFIWRLSLKEADRVLEIGAGGASFSLSIAVKTGAKVYALDSSEHALKSIPMNLQRLRPANAKIHLESVCGDCLR